MEAVHPLQITCIQLQSQEKLPCQHLKIKNIFTGSEAGKAPTSEAATIHASLRKGCWVAPGLSLNDRQPVGFMIGLIKPPSQTLWPVDGRFRSGCRVHSKAENPGDCQLPQAPQTPRQTWLQERRWERWAPFWKEGRASPRPDGMPTTEHRAHGLGWAWAGVLTTLTNILFPPSPTFWV